MKTSNHTPGIPSLALVLAIVIIPALVFGVDIPKGPKEPPKVVEPPKVPTAPKTVNVPKAPAIVKTPTVKEPPKVPKAPTIVKVPDAPKVPKAPVIVKTPTVKEPAKATKVPKAPDVAKIPDGPKEPKSLAKTPTIVKIPGALGPGRTLKEGEPNVPKGNKGRPTTESAAKNPKTLDTSGVSVKKTVDVQRSSGRNNSASEATLQEALAIIRGNRRNTDPGGPKSDLPAIDRSKNPLPAVPGSDEGSGNALQDALAIFQGTVTGAKSPLLSGPDTNNKPPVDQGFGEKPKSVDSSVGKGLSGNPTNALTRGGSIGGPLGEDAQNSGGKGPGGIAGQGIGAVSVGKSPKPFPLDANHPGSEVVSVEKEGGNEVSRFKDGSTLKIMADGRFVVKKENENVKIVQLFSRDGKLVEEHVEIKIAPLAPAPPPATPPATPPAAETPTNKTPLPSEDQHDAAAFAKFLRDNPALARQIAQSKSGGPGNIDPGNTDNSTTSGPGNGIAPPASGTTERNLVGQPGAAGGLGESGAAKVGLDFNQKRVGAIDLGPDQTVTAGNRRQSEGSFFDRNQPQQDFPNRTTAPTNDPGAPLTDPSALAKFLRENPAIAEQIVASRLVQAPKAPVKKSRSAQGQKAPGKKK